MNIINDGGPAFPTEARQYRDANGYLTMVADPAGMTLRDYFAAKAMQALIGFSGAAGYGANFQAENKNLSAAAFFVADAMLAAREVKP